jgi:hypothetical protein
MQFSDHQLLASTCKCEVCSGEKDLRADPVICWRSPYLQDGWFWEDGKEEKVFRSESRAWVRKD